MEVKSDYFVDLLEDVAYTAHEDTYRFILSVFQFWITRGFISDKQYDALEKLKDQVNYGDPYDDDVPF